MLILYNIAKSGRNASKPSNATRQTQRRFHNRVERTQHVEAPTLHPCIELTTSAKTIVTAWVKHLHIAVTPKRFTASCVFVNAPTHFQLPEAP